MTHVVLWYQQEYSAVIVCSLIHMCMHSHIKQTHAIYICTHTNKQHSVPSDETAKDVTVSSSYEHYLMIKENMITVPRVFQIPCYSTNFTIHYLHIRST